MSEITIGMKTVLDESNICFLDGKKFSKVEILWQVKIIVTPDSVKTEFAGINQVIVPDDKTVCLKIGKVNPAYPQNLHIGIISASISNNTITLFL